MYYCEKCGKLVTSNFGSGRFCSRSCANARVHSEETKQKISKSVKNNIKYIEYEGKYITLHEYNKIINQQVKKQEFIQKRSKLANLIDLKNSPYSEFDTAYCNSGSVKDCYYFTKHDENNKIVKRCVVPIYRYNIECELGRKLSYNEVVHHIDGDHFNNNKDNLIVLTRSEHNKLHSLIS